LVWEVKKVDCSGQEVGYAKRKLKWVGVGGSEVIRITLWQK